MIAFEQRASTVLFNVLRSHPVDGPFILPANVCPIVPMVFYKARRPFEFIDIAPGTLCISHDALTARWSEPRNRPAGLVYVRTYGAIFDTSEVFESIKSLTPHALIIDDRCLCPPEFNGTLAPNVDIALYSTGYAKYVDIDYGGFGVIRDGLPYSCNKSVFCARDLGKMTEQYKNALSLQSAFSYVPSDWLDTTMPQETWTVYRERVEQELIQASKVKAVVNSIYASRLPPGTQFPEVFQSWRFNIQVQDKAAVLDAIRSGGLFASGHYDSLVGVFGPGNAPIAQMLHRHVINLFNDHYFSSEQAIRLADILVDFNPLTPGPLFS